MRWKPSVVRTSLPGGLVVTVGHPLVDEYLEFLRARARTNTILAAAFDLKVFFSLVDKSPTRVTSADVLAFIRAQRGGGGKVVRIDGSGGLSSRTIRRRLSSVAGIYAYLLVRDNTVVTRNPVPRGLVTRREREGRRQGAPLVRTPKTLPRILAPAEVDTLFGALRTDRDRAMVEAMVLGGLRRCEVLGLDLADVRVGERRVFVADGKSGRQRLIPMHRGSSTRSAATSTKSALSRSRPPGCSWS